MKFLCFAAHWLMARISLLATQQWNVLSHAISRNGGGAGGGGRVLFWRHLSAHCSHLRPADWRPVYTWQRGPLDEKMDLHKFATKLRGANLVLKILLLQVNETSDWPSLVCRCGFAFSSVSKTNLLLANMSQICGKNWRVGWSLFFRVIWFSPIVKYRFEEFFCNG